MSKKIKMKLDKKMQKKKKEQSAKRMKIFSRIVLWAIIIAAGLLFFAMIYHLVNPPQDNSDYLKSFQTDTSSLDWEYEKIISSPANSEIYVKAIIKEIAQLTPSDFTFTMGDYYEENAREYFTNLLKSDFFSKNRKLIERAKESVKSKASISIIIIPDEHLQPLDLTWAESSIKRQKQIKDFIRQQAYPYVFVEGFSGEFNLQNMYRGYQEEANKGRLPKLTFEEFKIWNQEKSKNDWFSGQIAENSTTKVIGVDDSDFVFLLAKVQYLEQKTNFLKTLKTRSFKALTNAINFTFRDQMLLAKIIIFAQEHQIANAPFVVGADHMVTLPYHCKMWGINCKIEAIDPTFVAPQLEKLKEFEQKYGQKWPGN